MMPSRERYCVIVRNARRWWLSRPGNSSWARCKKESGHLDEKPQHLVKLARPFAVSKFEVTFEQWDACAADGACAAASDEGQGRGDRPVYNITWKDAKSYVAWLAKKTGQPYRLLSEAQWEYAARGGTTTPWFWGAAVNSFGSPKACEFANTHDETGKAAHPNYVWSHHQCADDHGESAPVGRFQPNPFGLYDILGNVREWVEDCHQLGYKDVPADGTAVTQAECELRVIRGGGWMDGASTSRAAYRHREAETFKNYQVGMRVARELNP